MPQNFLSCDREQDLLLPPSLRDWLPEDHFAWFLLDSLKALELSAFYGAYRADGHGRAAYEPSMMVGLVLYSYATGERSARGVERHCRDDLQVAPAVDRRRLAADSHRPGSLRRTKPIVTGDGLQIERSRICRRTRVRAVIHLLIA